MSNYYLLIAVLIVLVIGAVKGYMKGFLRLAVWFAGLIAVLFIVTKLSPYVSDFLIKNTSIYDDLRGKIITAYEDGRNEAPPEAVPDTGSGDAIDSFGFPELITDSIKTSGSGEIYDKLAGSFFKEYIAGYLSELSIKAGTFVGLFIMLWIIQLAIILAVHIMEKIPVLRTFNRLLGMAAGITLSLVLVWLFFLAVMMFFGNSFGAWVFAQVRASRILTYLFNNNLLFDLL
ncbi:MAG: hypothetical protein K6G58_05010 [Lachnospiraceae bacterium]|nr:hypothetical protein [Lachnospiraceae bacterium]